MNIHTGELETVFDHHNLTYYLSNKEYGDQEMVTFPEDYDYLSILDTSEFKVDPSGFEVKTENDTIDFEIRISEGPLAYFNKKDYNLFIDFFRKKNFLFKI